jgi:hypothetical protein
MIVVSLFFLGLRLGLDEKFTTLARQARASSRRPHSNSDLKTFYRAGIYDLPGVSFHLQNHVIGYLDGCVHGYASNGSILALISDEIEENCIFVDDEQQLLRLNNIFLTDHEVKFYNVSVEDPTEIFTNLRVHPTAYGDPKHIGEVKGDLLLPAVSEAQLTFTGETNGVSGTKCDGMKIHFAAGLDSFGWGDWLFNGLGSLRVDVGFGFEAKIGFSVTVEKAAKSGGLCEIAPACQRVSAAKVSVAGYEIRADLWVCVNLALTHVPGVELKPIKYSRQWGVTASRSGTFATWGCSLSRPKIEIIPDLRNMLPFMDIFKTVREIRNSFSPTVEIYTKTEVKLGDNKRSYIVKMGFRLKFDFSLSPNRNNCPAPYVWRSGHFSVIAFAEAPDVISGERTLMKRWEDTTTVFDRVEIPGGCIFNRENMDELPAMRSPSSPVFEIERRSDGISLKLRRGQLYPVIIVNRMENIIMDKGDCYAIIKVIDLTPLVEARQLESRLWAIRLNEVVFSNGVLKLPFLRHFKADEQDVFFELLEVFSGSAELYCKSGLGKIQVSSSFVGCVESSSRTGNMPSDWLALMFSPRPGGVPVTKVVRGEERCQILLFNVEYRWGRPDNVEFLPSKHLIEEDTAFIGLPVRFTEPLVRADVRIVFVAPNANGVIIYPNVYRGDGIVLAGSVSSFEGKIPSLGTVRVVATTGDPNVAFRVFRYSVKGCILLTYGSEEGLIQVRGPGLKFRSGFKSQIFKEETTAVVWKSWVGAPVQVELATPGEIVIRRMENDHRWMFTVGFIGTSRGSRQSTEVTIPWGVGIYSENPEQFFKNLGITKGFGHSKYRLSDADLSKDGVLYVNKDRFPVEKQQAMRDNKTRMAECLDLAEHQIDSVAVVQSPNGPNGPVGPLKNADAEEDVSGGLKGDIVLLVEVALACFVGAVIISLLILLVYRRRCKTKKESSSTIWDASSSDDQRKENLVDKVK